MKGLLTRRMRFEILEKDNNIWKIASLKWKVASLISNKGKAILRKEMRKLIKC